MFIKTIAEHNFNVDSAINAPHATTLIHLACAVGNLSIVRTLLEMYNCQFLKDEIGITPFEVACMNKHLEIVAYLCPFVFTKTDISGEHVLRLACESGYSPMVNLLLLYFTSNSGLELLKCEDKNALFYLYLVNDFSAQKCYDSVIISLKAACLYGNLPMIKFLFGVGSTIGFFNRLLNCVNSLVDIACKHRHTALLDYFDQLLCDNTLPRVSVQRSWDNTKLCKTISTKYNPFSESSLSYAVRQGNHFIYEYLTSLKYHSSLICNVNSNGETLLHVACISGDLKMVKNVFRIEDIDKQSNIGNTCLHLASMWGALDVSNFLIRKGCQVNIKNKGGCTPLHLAISYKQLEIVDYFFELSGVDINTTASKGETLLHLFAFSSSFIKYAKKILAQSDCASINQKDNYGNTPLFNAVCVGNQENDSAISRQ